jgi:V/A-type H+-transporting ATPase subunit K
LGGDANLSAAKGLAYLFACLPMAFVGYHSAISQGKASIASLGLLAKRPEAFGKAMIFPAMVETYAILALLISMLAINGVTNLNI